METMNLKKKIANQIQKSGLENKEVLLVLDEIRKDYHNPQNVGNKVVSQKELSKKEAVILGKSYPVSKGKETVFYKGGWRKIHGAPNANFIIYLKANYPLEFKKK